MRILVFIILVLGSCTESAPGCETCTCLTGTEQNVLTNDCKKNYTCSFELFSGSAIAIADFNGVAKGNKLVFKMENATEGSKLIADDEFTNILIFEIDPDAESFSFKDGSLANAKVYFKRVCFCAEVKFMAPSRGCLQGKKRADGTWEVAANLVIPYTFGEEVVLMDARFK